MSNTFTFVAIFVQFESFFTGTAITSRGIFTNLIAAMARISRITFVDVFEDEQRKLDGYSNLIPVFLIFHQKASI